MKESQVFQEGRTAEPLEVIVVRDRSEQNWPIRREILTSDAPLSTQKLTQLHVGTNRGSAVAAGLIGLVACSGVFMGLGHFFGVLAQNWEGSFAVTPLRTERGWEGPLRAEWALAPAPPFPELVLRYPHNSFETFAYYRRPILVPQPSMPVNSPAVADVIGLRNAFFAWKSAERGPLPLSIQEESHTSGVEYSEQKIILSDERRNSIVAAVSKSSQRRRQNRRSKEVVVLSRELSRPAPEYPTPIEPLQVAATPTLAQRFAEAPAQVPAGFSWEMVRVSQAHMEFATQAPQAKPVGQVVVPTQSPTHVDAKVNAVLMGVAASVTHPAEVRCSKGFVAKGAGGVDVQPWTRELGLRQWSRARVANSWPTAFFDRVSECVPVLTQSELNTAVQDSALSLHPQMGVLYGKVAPGWEIELAGRSSRDLHWGPVDLGGMRTFYWTNLPPGFVTLRYFLHDRPQEGGALALPLQSGVATYVDLRDIRRVTVSGRVISGSSKKAMPIAGADVMAIHHRAAAVRTDRDGVFVLSPLWLANGYSLDLDVDYSKTWTHRYSVSAETFDSKEVTLYMIESAQVQSWLRSLQGGVSPESALVIGAISNSTRESLSADSLLPQLEPWERRVNLEPESYSISSHGDLRPGLPLEKGADRFMLIQVPAGPSKVLFATSRGEEALSQLRYHSPGVITVVGPF